MSTTRFLNILIAVVLVMLVVLAVQPAQAAEAAAPSCLAPGEVSSLQAAYSTEYNGWFPYTSSGYTGVDGGLIAMLSDRTSCSN